MKCAKWSQRSGSGARTRHNLSMIGDMPIAQPNTLTLLAFLNLAIERGAGRTEVVRRAIDVATYLGAVICCPPRRLPARSS